MNLNSNSPFSGKPLSECDERELDSWCAARCGYTVALFENDWYFCDVKNPGVEIPAYGTLWEYAGPLMERKEWPQTWALWPYKGTGNLTGCDYHVGRLNDYDDDDEPIASASTPTAAIRNAFVIAATHAKEATNEPQKCI